MRGDGSTTAAWDEMKRGGVVGKTSPRISMWMFPKIVGFPPKSSILIGFPF